MTKINIRVANRKAFSGKEQFGYSERLVAKLQEKGLNNVLDMYISKT